MRISQRCLLLCISIGLVIGTSLYLSESYPSSAALAESVQASDFSTETGKSLYEQHCLSCHATDGAGSKIAPALVSNKINTWSLEKASDYMTQNMPKGAPGSLRQEQYQLLAKYVLSLNGTPTDFIDIEDYWAQSEIEQLWNNKVVDGYVEQGQLLFKPEQAITRAEFVTYLVKAKNLFITNEDSTNLTDIDQLKNNKKYILTAIEYGLIEGYPDQTFRPKKPITRAEIASILARSELLGNSQHPAFLDVPSDHWAYDAILAVKEAELFDGYEDGTFHPDDSIKRGEAATVIYRLMQK